MLTIVSSACKRESKPRPKENTPAFVDPAVDEISKYRNANDTKGAFKFIDSIRNIFIDKDLSYKFYVYYLYADTYEREHDLETTRKYCDTILSLLENNEPSNFCFNNYVWTYFFIAEIELERGNLDIAYEYYYRALALAEEYKDGCAIGYYYLRTGHIIYSTGHYLDAAEYFKRGYENSFGCDDNFGTYLRQQQTLNNIGLCFEKVGMYDSAVYYYKKGIDNIEPAYKKFPQHKQWLIGVSKAVFDGNLGGVYVKQGRTGKEVEDILLSSITTNEQIGHDLLDAQYTRVKLAEYYINIKQLGKAKNLLDNIKSVSDTLYNYTVYVRWNKAMWHYWDAKNNVANAYYYLQAYKVGIDSIKSSKVNFSLANVDNNVKNLGNKYKISVLEQDASLRKFYLLIAIIIIALAITIIFLVVKNTSRTKKHIKTLQEMNHQINDQKLKIKNAFDDLESADSEKDRILKAVSHDMRSPINSALAIIDILSADTSNLTEEQMEYVKLIKDSCNNALSLTKDLLEIATLESSSLEKELQDINVLVKNRIDLLQFRAAEKKQNIALSLPDYHLSAHVNQDKFARVVSNLVNNAIKFSPSESEINVKLWQEEDNIILSIKDNGIGIPENIQDKIFDIFTEAKRFGTSGEQPFGLGLSISKQIVEAHNGNIWFESAENKGATFYVKIPCSV